jgi:hypothetical protein
VGINVNANNETSFVALHNVPGSGGSHPYRPVDHDGVVSEGSMGHRPGPPAVAPAMACEALVFHDFASIPDAPTRITSAEMVTTEGVKPLCKITGYVAPQVGFELHLPAGSDPPGATAKTSSRPSDT